MTSPDLNLLEQLRPETPALEADWAAATLTSILASPAMARRPRRSFVAGATVAATVLGLGGVAWASGQFPSPFDEDPPQALQSQVAEWGGDDLAAELRAVIDVTLPDGTGFVAWRAEGDTTCEAISHTPAGTPRNQMWNGGTGCGTSALDDTPSVWVTCEDAVTPSTPKAWRTVTWYPVVYGVTTTAASSVRVHGTFAWTGAPIDLTIPVNPTTGGYADTLPVSWPADAYPEDVHMTPTGLTFSYLDASGEVLDRWHDTWQARR